MERQVLVQPNECGLPCPVLTTYKKCGQEKCPVDCVVGDWTNWGKCSKVCESGISERTRQVLTDPANGGAWCDPPTESRVCNTHSCDSACTLSDWTDWSPCSMACTAPDSPSGYQTRHRDVIVPTRGEGKCPSPESDIRSQVKACNTHLCSGQEECYAMQDLVLVIDSSSSVTAANFPVVKDYVAHLVSRYKGDVTGNELMKIGILQFGNGQVVQEDHGITGALQILSLTSDMQSVSNAIEGLQYLNGLTNMAQALSMAEMMLVDGGRATAQSAIMVITDGMPTFKAQTSQIVQELEDKGIQRFFVMVSDIEGDTEETELMKKWASAPWYDNFIQIHGWQNLQSAYQTFTQKTIVMFCPMSQSPSKCHAILYQHGNFGGWRVDLQEGGYDMQAMVAHGAKNDEMSAIKVFGTGCVATLYKHWDFTGYAVAYPEGFYSFRAFLRQGAKNDDVSSIRIASSQSVASSASSR